MNSKPTAQLGMIGLGRMGANMVRRLLKDGHRCVVFDRSPEAVNDLAKEHAVGADSLADLVIHQLKAGRNCWLNHGMMKLIYFQVLLKRSLIFPCSFYCVSHIGCRGHWRNILKRRCATCEVASHSCHGQTPARRIYFVALFLICAKRRFWRR